MSEEGSEQRLEARKLMAEAAAMYADSYEGSRGGIVTGYITVFEVALPVGDPYCFWVCGNGDEPQDTYTGGLPAWRAEGLVRWAIRDIIVGNVKDDH